jgi:preprotein translocase subunit SecY
VSSRVANIFTEIWEMEDLRKRVLFTLGIIGIYRLGIFIPAPGIDREVLSDFFEQQRQGGGNLFGLYDMFTGGALQQFSVFTLGIMPYITSSIIMQLLTVMVPALERIQKEGQTGRNKIIQYTRYLTICISIVQGTGMAIGMEQMRMGTSSVVIHPGLGFKILTVITLTAGSCFIMWLGEQISERGVGNGSSILITGGIMARLPASAANMIQLINLGEINLLQASLMLCGMFVVIMAIVYVERGQRRIPIQYAKRVLGRRVYEGQTTHLPLKLNTSGVVPPIFASSLLMFPATLSTFSKYAFLDWLSSAFQPGRWLYNVTYLGLIVFFAFFYTAVTFNPVDVAENLKKQGGYIPRIRPGNETAEYIDRLLSRLTTGGALYLGAIAILPTILVRDFHMPFQFGGTGLLILVGVTLDTVAQIEAHLMTRHYDGLVGPKGSRVKGRRRLVTSRGAEI